MSRAPAPHVEPFHSSARKGTILLVQKDQLLLGSNCCVLQHPFQLKYTTDTHSKDISSLLLQTTE